VRRFLLKGSRKRGRKKNEQRNRPRTGRGDLTWEKTDSGEVRFDSNTLVICDDYGGGGWVDRLLVSPFKHDKGGENWRRDAFIPALKGVGGRRDSPKQKKLKEKKYGDRGMSSFVRPTRGTKERRGPAGGKNWSRIIK